MAVAENSGGESQPRVIRGLARRIAAVYAKNGIREIFGPSGIPFGRQFFEQEDKGLAPQSFAGPGVQLIAADRSVTAGAVTNVRRTEHALRQVAGAEVLLETQMDESINTLAAGQQQAATPRDPTQVVACGHRRLGDSRSFHGLGEPAADLAFVGENARLFILRRALRLQAKGNVSQPAFALLPVVMRQTIGNSRQLAAAVDGIDVGIGDLVVENGLAVGQVRSLAMDHGHQGQQIGRPGEAEGNGVARDGRDQIRGFLARFDLRGAALAVPVGGKGGDAGIVEGHQVTPCRPGELRPRCLAVQTRRPSVAALATVAFHLCPQRGSNTRNRLLIGPTIVPYPEPGIGRGLYRTESRGTSE